VVGGGASLLELGVHAGAEIDAHHTVFRFNDHPFGSNWFAPVPRAPSGLWW
jgi:hypothetical protein